MGARRSSRRLLVAGATLAMVLSAAAVVFWPERPESGAPDLRSLISPVESREFDRAYWLGQAEADGPSWRLALALCGDRHFSTLPNCRNVLDAERAVAVPRRRRPLPPSAPVEAAP